MFKKFFDWIKSIHEKIYNAKVEEFRRYYGVTYVDEEMHKDKNLERYYMNKYPMPSNMKGIGKWIIMGITIAITITMICFI